jgi:hypothetical protein
MSVLVEIGGTTVRPAPLGSLGPGVAFLLMDPRDRTFIVGSVVKQAVGYTKVTLVGEEELAYVPDKKKGGLREFTATSSYETEWSRGTMVYPVASSERPDAGHRLPDQSAGQLGSVPSSPPATWPQGAAASRGTAEVTKTGRTLTSSKSKGRSKVTDSIPVQVDKKGRPVRPPNPVIAPDRSKPGAAVLKPSNAVKEEPIIPVKKEAIMAKVEKAQAKAAKKGTTKGSPLKAKEKKAPTPKVPTNICPGSGELVFRKFKPGMDARYYGWLKKIVRGTMKTTELPDYTRKHLAKVDSSIMRAIEKELTEHGVDVAALKAEAAE